MKYAVYFILSFVFSLEATSAIETKVQNNNASNTVEETPAPPPPSSQIDTPQTAGWIIYVLDSKYRPREASLSGVTILTDEKYYYRWYHGRITRLIEATGPFVMSNIGSIAITYPYSNFWTLTKRAQRSYMQIWPVGASSPNVYFPPSEVYNGISNEAGIYPYTDTNQAIDIQQIDDTGVVWAEQGYRNEVQVKVSASGASPHHVQGDVVFINHKGTVVSSDGEYSGRYYIDNSPIDFKPYYLSDQDVIIGYRENYGSLVWYADGTEEPLPQAGDFSAWAQWIDSQGRFNGQRYVGYDANYQPIYAPVLFKQTLNADGVPIIPATYTTVDYIPLALGNGWKTDHLVAPGTTAPQLGLAWRTAADATVQQNSFVAIPIASELAVDLNHDSLIKLSGENSDDMTTKENSYRFWINDDDDDEYASMIWTHHDPEYYPARRPDSADRIINSPRDCEDLARLWLNIGALRDMLKSADSNLYIGLKWTNVNSGTPGIRLFRSADPDGGMGHLKNAAVAASQAGGTGVTATKYCLLDADVPDTTVIANDATDTVRPTSRIADFIFKKRDVESLSVSQPTLHLLFEGVSEGKGELQIVFLKKNGSTWEGVGNGPGVWLDLKNIRRMYVRAHSTPLPAQFPLPYEQGFFPTFPYSVDGEGALIILPSKLDYAMGDSIEGLGDFSFEAPSGEQAKCVVSVHGIDCTVPEEQGYAQSFFKRLWWEGYRGRFVTFRWCTTLDAGMFRPGQPNISIFNSGEYRSWKGGTSLKNFVTSLHLQLPSNTVISVAAHSLGNACAGEALRLGMQVNSYVAMEAAVSLSAYYPEPSNPASDPLAGAFLATLVQADVASPTPRSASQLGYRGWLSAIHTSSTAKLVAYQNLDDFWLATGETSFGLDADWVHNQINHKPDDRWGFGEYDYDLVNSMRRPGFSSDLTIARWVNDPHEAMAYVSRSRTRALGAEPATGSPTPPGFQSLDLNAIYHFSTSRPDHSGQFQRNIQYMYGDETGVQWSESFYHRLMRDLNVDAP